MVYMLDPRTSRLRKLSPASLGSPGQIGVIILLIMVVLMTIGLSVASRTTQDLFLSQQTADSTRVFNAAEAGIEDALSTTFSFEGETFDPPAEEISGTNASVDYQIRKVYVLETRVFEGTSVKVDTTGVPAAAGLLVQWSRETNCSTEDPASLIVDIYYEESGVTRVRHVPLGACNTRGDNFPVATTISTDGYRRQATVDLQPGDLFARIKPVYADTHLRVTGSGWTLPVQYFAIRSEARSTLGDETRAVLVNRTLPTAPSIMDYTVLSGTSLVK
jgi:hypothetical protein